MNIHLHSLQNNCNTVCSLCTNLALLISSAMEVKYSPPSIHLSVWEQDYGKSFQAIFMKPCRTMQCHGKKPLNQISGLFPLKNAEWQLPVTMTWRTWSLFIHTAISSMAMSITNTFVNMNDCILTTCNLLIPEMITNFNRLMALAEVY